MRVIAGALKGRRLVTPTWIGLRPTSDKLRETLFNVLAARVVDAHVLDGCAGTGALGIEALSRGAAHVTFVDSDVRAATLIAENLRRSGLTDRHAIIRAALESLLHSRLVAQRFDLILLDPPYDEPDPAGMLGAAGSLLQPAGLIVLEHAKRRGSPAEVGTLTRTRELLSGDSTLSFYEIRDVPGNIVQ